MGSQTELNELVIQELKAKNGRFILFTIVSVLGLATAGMSIFLSNFMNQELSPFLPRLAIGISIIYFIVLWFNDLKLKTIRENKINIVETLIVPAGEKYTPEELFDKIEVDLMYKANFGKCLILLPLIFNIALIFMIWF